MAYHQQRQASDLYLTRASELAGRSQFAPASAVMDRRFGTDLLVYDTPTGTVGVRTRTSSALCRDPLDFTIRSRTVSGGETELDKIMAGSVNRMFYGVLNREQTDYDRWMYFNLNVLRDAMNKWRTNRANGAKIFPFWEVRDNGDGTAFYVFSAGSKVLMHPLFMIDCSESCGYKGRVAYRDIMASQPKRPANNNDRRTAAA